MSSGVVVDVGNAVNSFILNEIGNRLDQSLFVDLIGELGHNNAHSAVFIFFDFRSGSYSDFTSARCVSGTDSGATHNDTGGREIRPLDVFHEFFQGRIGIVNQTAHTVDDFTEVVRRNIRRHTDGNTR